ncbi:MAG TPA: hypothetical protein VKM93_21875 [Terriglobia bacterium]|nr:hypothetical protein [Terriglobia bacterium]
MAACPRAFALGYITSPLRGFWSVCRFVLAVGAISGLNPFCALFTFVLWLFAFCLSFLLRPAVAIGTALVCQLLTADC